ncbi:uncharacterized protein E0L32_002226 [Thyridium curvatum]|uniref:Uncharacterized protein n=1 Tax=Thyridium curvatum TaxID=1093900 RepID=A0A507ARC7_9PEZI|nr:uncharacterized protein E0L32_002226 [Thyridium curvatum]TPX06730.1 hypothetical protein E0L32_002226 [Thyridium curvatum]
MIKSNDEFEALVGRIANLLTARGIPAVLWEGLLLNVHGSFVSVSSVNFVIPDSLIPDATEALAYDPVLDLRQCEEDDAAGHKDHPRPTAHMHCDTNGLEVGFFPQSTTLWFLGAMDRDQARRCLPPIEGLIKASDSSLPSVEPGQLRGRFLTTEAPIWVLPVHSLLEACVRCMMRDGRRHFWHYYFMLQHIRFDMDKDGYLDLGKLSNACRSFYVLGAKATGAGENMPEILENLEKELEEEIEGELVGLGIDQLSLS